MKTIEELIDEVRGTRKEIEGFTKQKIAFCNSLIEQYLQNCSPSLRQASQETRV